MENSNYELPRGVKIINEALEESKQQKKEPKEKEEKQMPQEKIVLSTKEDGLLWFEMLKSLSMTQPNNGIISFPNCFEKICTKFSMTKTKAWNCLFFLSEFGLIEIIKGHGIRLNYSIC